jgi:hypothetical protein
LSMSYQVSMNDVSKAANVSISTVSLVVNGKADRRRISPATQERVRAVARQLGYQPNQLARDIVLGRGKPPRGIPDKKSQMAEIKADRRQIGLILSAASSTDSLNVIPGLTSILDAAGYRLIFVTVSTDPAAARVRVIRFLADGLAGILCCPTVYPAALATVAETYPDPGRRVPVIVLWPGAGQAMMRAIENPGSSEAFSNSPIPPVQMVPPIQMEGAAPSAPVNMPAAEEPVPVVSVPLPAPVDTAVTVTRPPFIQEPVVVTPPEPEPVPEPVATPEPVVVETPPPTPETEEKPA